MSEAPTPEAPAPEAPPVEAPAPEAAPPVETPSPETPPEEAPSEEAPAEETPPPAVEVKLPEGFEVQAEVMSEFQSLAAEAGLSQETAQKLTDFYAKQVQAFTDAQTKLWTDTVQGWEDQLNSDPELGGDRKEAVQTALGRALDEYGSTEAREAFESTGAGWHPAIVKFVYNMAKALGEGTPVSAPGPARTLKKGVEALYGNPQ